MNLSKHLLRGTLVALVVFTTVWFWLLHTESGAAFAWARVEAALSGDLSGDFRSGDFGDGIELENIRFRTDGVEVLVRSARATADIDLFPLQANVSAVYLSGVRVESKPTDTDADGELDVGSLLSGLRLPIRFDLVDARVEEIELSVDAGEALLIERLDVSAFWHNSIVIRKLLVSHLADKVAVDGRIDLLAPQLIDLSIDAVYDDIAYAGDISGNEQFAQVNKLVVNGADVDARGSATLRWAEGISGDANVLVDRLNLAAYTDAWPVTHPVSGTLNVEATGDEVRFSESSLAIENSDAVLHFDGVLNRITSSISADLRWLSLQWPIDAATPSVRSADGSVLLSGDFDEWNIDGTIAVGTEQMSDGRFQLAGGGDRDRLALTIQDGEVFGGSIAGQTEYSWRDAQNWSAALQFEDLQTGEVAPDWPGEISGQADAHGSLKPFVIDATIRDVGGDIRGEALTANGSFSYSDAGAYANELSIVHGGAEFLLDGSADTSNGLVFSGSVTAIEAYIDSVAGGFDASGRFSTVQGDPYFSVNLNSDELRIGEILLDGLQIVDTRADDEIAGVVIQVQQVTAAEQNIADVELKVSVKKDRQTLSVRGTNRDAVIQVGVDGAFDDWSAVFDSPWRGHVSSFSLDLEDVHTLHLEQPAELELSSERIALNAFCLADEGSSELCVDASREADGMLDLNATMQNVPLALIEHVSATSLRFDQSVSGNLTWAGNPDAGANGKGEIEFSAGRITSSLKAPLSIPTGTGLLSFDITDGDLLSGAVSIPMPGLGGIEGDFKVLELTHAATSGVSGHLNVEMSDIGILVHLLPELDAASGELTADFNLSGTMTEPLLTGAATLENAALEYGPIGLRLDDMNLVAEMDESRAIELSGSFRAGDGYGEIVSSGNYQDIEQPGLRFKIRGEDLQLVNVPDIQLIVKPDIELAYSGDTLEINGSLLIPRARIAPSDLAESRVNESDDVVIVAGQLLEETETEEAKSDLVFDGVLEVELGDDVVIDLDLARATLSGSSVFDWQGGPIPRATGRYNLVGSVQAFGQVLQITEGGVRYANVPANEPTLRIKAEREIYGNSQVKRAGILVDGTADHPTIVAYTYPLTTEERALTLLVTGSDFDYEQGVGAIDFGTYIAPRLFVSYGVGIFDNENIISARYDLAKGFGIKASSGNKTSGMDLNYRFEN